MRKEAEIEVEGERVSMPCGDVVTGQKSNRHVQCKEK
jgi:hypothetical protein